MSNLPRLFWSRTWDRDMYCYTYYCLTAEAEYTVYSTHEGYFSHAVLWDGTELDFGPYVTLRFAKQKCRLIESSLRY